jgi:signal transduction histidine kinase
MLCSGWHYRYPFFYLLRHQALSTRPLILNVEDISANRILVRRILESEGYRVEDAVTAIEGIEKASEIEPDLILMDINLPDLDGFAAVTRIRSISHLARIPIIALTARTVHNDRERALAIGCDGYINKPFDFDELLSAISGHLATGRQDNGATTDREHYLREHSAALSEQLQQKLSELQAAYERLKQLEEAKRSFISVASHELRTPLTVVTSYTQMLQMLPVMKENETAGELLDGLLKGVDRLKDIINDMVSVVRVELSQASFKFVPISIRSILKAVDKNYAAVAGQRNISLAIDTAKNISMVNGDFEQLASAINRIVGNAIKYTPDGGRVTVAAKMTDRTGSDAIDFIEIMISDSGVGIALDKQKLIFEKFSTAADVSLHSTSKSNFMGGGAGLGLTIAKGIIESHSGRIWVESEGFDPDKLPGSKFFILLPAL